MPFCTPEENIREDSPHILRFCGMNSGRRNTVDTQLRKYSVLSGNSHSFRASKFLALRQIVPQERTPYSVLVEYYPDVVKGLPRLSLLFIPLRGYSHQAANRRSSEHVPTTRSEDHPTKHGQDNKGIPH
jgi:hypothetical protein